MSILVVGSVALDSISTPRASAKQILGGSATYFSLAASFFAPVNLLAVVGKDFPARYFRLFEKRGVNLSGLEIKQGKTFSWKGQYGRDFSGPKTLSTCLNVFSEFNPVISREYKKSKYLFLANIDPLLQENVLKQINPRLIACDTMNHWIEEKRRELLRLLKRADIFFLNAAEAKLLTCQSNIVKAARILLKSGVRFVIVKKGEHGAVLVSDNYIFSLPAFLREEIVDPTGAGDTFAGGFMGYLAECSKFSRANIKRALAYGAVLASFAVEEFGIKRLLQVDRQAIEKRFKEFQAISCF